MITILMQGNMWSLVMHMAARDSVMIQNSNVTRIDFFYSKFGKILGLVFKLYKMH